MIPVIQTRLSTPDKPAYGNCFTACIASILELPIEQVPNFIDYGRDWFIPFLQFIEDAGYTYDGTYYIKNRRTPEELERFHRTFEGVDGYYIVGGGSPRGFSLGHAVVYKGGELVHDPHPDGGGVTELWWVYMIVKKK
jgi:hypothetical protein